MSYMSVITHFDSFDRGVLSTKDAIYYLSVIFVGSSSPPARWNLFAGGRNSEWQASG